MRVVFLAPGFEDSEANEAAAWGSDHELIATRAEPNEWGGALEGSTVAWCHAADEVPAIDHEIANLVAEWVLGGGSLLLSHLAAPLAHRFGAPGVAPLVEKGCVWNDAADPLWPDDFRDWPDYPHVRGFQGWGDHPLFDGLQRGTFTWRPRRGERWSRAFYQAPAWPDGNVIAVERAYVQLDASRAVAWEWQLGRGRILCLGANLALRGEDSLLAAQRNRLLMNALASLEASRGAVAREYWPRFPRIVRRVPPPLALPTTPVESFDPTSPPLVFEQHAPDASPLVLAGRRTLALGTETLGVTELWIYPLCLWSGGEGWRVDGTTLRATHVSIEPAVVTRELSDHFGRRWRERIAVAPDAPEFHLELTRIDPAPPERPESSETPELTLAMRLRLQWPMPADVLHPLVTTSQHDARRWSITVASGMGDASAALLVDGAAACGVEESPTAPLVRLRALSGAQPLRLSVVASSRGALSVAGYARRAASEGMTATIRRQRARIATLLQRATSLESPDAELNLAWTWALARLTSFVAEVPGVGAGLLAGFAPTRPGWSDSRPGYAWFFGRDACWSADALLAAGLFDEARIALEFLASTRDVTGKIAHEITTSGVAHYDAADSTPLWLRLVAAYAEWTGDLATLRVHWDAVKDAFAFVQSTDRDGDGLPENSSVGHGWIESGSLGGGDTTSYTAAIWIDALRRLAPVATAMGDADFADRCGGAYTRALHAFERVLRDRQTGRIALHRRADGSLDTTLTALAAVPILLGVDPSDMSDVAARTAVDDILEALSLPTFSAPWGVRLISSDSAEYQPRGYHSGAVWPLFTGWVAWAEFVARRPEHGLEHLRAIAHLARERAKGAFDEVLDGDVGTAAGVAPDQAWSAAMLIAPLLHGMLGLTPCAAESRCTITPRWTASWPDATLRNLRVGSSVFSVRVQRLAALAASGTSPEHEYHVELQAGAPITIEFVHPDAPPRTFDLTMTTPVTLRLPAPRQTKEGLPNGRR